MCVWLQKQGQILKTQFFDQRRNTQTRRSGNHTIQKVLIAPCNFFDGLTEKLNLFSKISSASFAFVKRTFKQPLKILGLLYLPYCSYFQKAPKLAEKAIQVKMTANFEHLQLIFAKSYISCFFFQNTSYQKAVLFDKFSNDETHNEF